MNLDNIVDPKISPAQPVVLIENINDFEISDFIGTWKNIIPQNLCDKVIDHYDKKRSGNINPTISSGDCIGCLTNPSANDFIYGENHFQIGHLGRSDTQFILDYSDPELSSPFKSFLKACACHYIKYYPQLSYMKFQNDCLKFQHTAPGEGYHTWHFENSSTNNRYRELAWTIYLNDVPNGEGETEFLYQKKRIQPSVGTVCIWPAGMTHVHRGNTVLTQDKYILTGWFTVVPNE